MPELADHDDLALFRNGDHIDPVVRVDYVKTAFLVGPRGEGLFRFYAKNPVIPVYL